MATKSTKSTKCGAPPRQVANQGACSLWCLFVLLVAIEFWLPSGLFAQVAPAPAQPPRPTPDTSATSRDVWQSLRSLSLADVLTWLREHGLAIVLILFVATVILWLANRLHHRFVALLSSRAGRGSAVEQEKRARTLVGVLHNALRTAVIAAGAIMILEEVGVPVGPLLGGAAVVGLAVAFGAQSLIKDYFTGFLVLLEQQYMIGDVVKIGAITGQVEKITLRLTVLRDVEGSVHFIPHGQITLVSNLTHGWSQVVFDLHVNSGEPVERIRDLFFELVKDLRSDQQFESMILNDAEMLGVDSLSDATYTLKFSLRTLPLKRWEVKRELLRRLKERFQKLQIKVTVPA
jgi:moderate conductance mechanosensitive channel